MPSICYRRKFSAFWWKSIVFVVEYFGGLWIVARQRRDLGHNFLRRNVRACDGPICQISSKLPELFPLQVKKIADKHSNITCESKKTAPFYFCNNFVKPSSILIIFGTHIRQSVNFPSQAYRISHSL